MLCRIRIRHLSDGLSGQKKDSLPDRSKDGLMASKGATMRTQTRIKSLDEAFVLRTAWRSSSWISSGSRTDSFTSFDPLIRAHGRVKISGHPIMMGNPSSRHCLTRVDWSIVAMCISCSAVHSSNSSDHHQSTVLVFPDTLTPCSVFFRQRSPRGPDLEPSPIGRSEFGKISPWLDFPYDLSDHFYKLLHYAIMAHFFLMDSEHELTQFLPFSRFHWDERRSLSYSRLMMVRLRLSLDCSGSISPVDHLYHDVLDTPASLAAACGPPRCVSI